MLSIYTGVPGSGKTTHAVTDILWACRAGRPVLTNISIDAAHLPKADVTCSQNLTPREIVWWADDKGFRGEGGLLLVIDEAQLFLNSRDWQHGDRADWLSLFTQHRKLGLSIVLIAQHETMLDKQCRNVCDSIEVHRSLRGLKWLGGVLSLLTGGRLYYSMAYWPQGKFKLSSDWHLRTPAVERLFDTRQSYGGAGAGVPAPALRGSGAPAHAALAASERR